MRATVAAIGLCAACATPQLQVGPVARSQLRPIPAAGTNEVTAISVGTFQRGGAGAPHTVLPCDAVGAEWPEAEQAVAAAIRKTRAPETVDVYAASSSDVYDTIATLARTPPPGTGVTASIRVGRDTGYAFIDALRIQQLFCLSITRDGDRITVTPKLIGVGFVD